MAGRAERLHVRKGRLLLLSALIVAALFWQIGLCSQVSARAKQIDELNAQLTQLRKERQGLEFELEYVYANLERVRDEAVNRLGMQMPGEGQIRTVALPSEYLASASASSLASAASGESEKE